MENSKEEGRVSITLDGSQESHQLKVENEAKTQKVAFDVDKHYGSISVKYDEGHGPLVFSSAAIGVMPQDEPTDELKLAIDEHKPSSPRANRYAKTP